jgi:hypothetical protein
VGGFYNSASNVGFVFSDAMANGVAKYVAEAASHEAGHLFGLWHQSTYGANGQKTAEYSEGNTQWAPIMGVGYYAAVTTWFNGPNNLGRTSFQDEISILSGSSNGFGYRTDEAGNNTSTAATLNVSSNSVSGSGVISQSTDQDYYRFSTSGGNVSITASTIAVGANLDTVLELRRADGTLVTTATPSNSLNATVTANLSAGDYYLVVRSTGVYGFVGQYALSGTVPTAVPGGNSGTQNSGNNNSGNNSPGNNTTGGNTGGNSGGSTGGNTGGNSGSTSGPEIKVTEGGTNIGDNTAVVSYGTVRKGTVVSKTFTVTNEGDSNLTLTQLKKKVIPKGFKLERGFGDTALSAGESTTFTISMKKGKGNYNGMLSFTNNDTDEGTFNFRLTGVVNKTGIVGGKSEIVGGGSIDSDLAFGVSLADSLDVLPGLAGSVDITSSDIQIRADDGREIIQSHIAFVTADENSRATPLAENLAEVDRCFEEGLDDLADLLSEALSCAT